jgi:Flp pilus assembly protein TadG
VISRRPERRPAGARDSGAAVVEFTLVMVLLLFLFIALLQLALTLHVRNTLVASAAEGARYGANADRSPAEGAALTRRLVRDSLSGRHARDISAGHESVGGTQTVYVEIRTSVPLLGLLGPSRRLVVRGHAMEES